MAASSVRWVLVAASWLALAGCVSGRDDAEGADLGSAADRRAASGPEATGSSGSSGSSGSTDAAAVCRQLTNKLFGCNLISDADADCGGLSDSGDSCQVSCALQASCGDLEMLFCAIQGGAPPNVASISPGLIQCWTECTSSSDFDCGDGDTVPGDWVCDGGDDCENGADEADCEGVSPAVDCFDEPDAPGCASFECDDGERVPEDYQCDGGEDCADGSDERGCPSIPQLLCMGEPIDPDQDSGN